MLPPMQVITAVRMLLHHLGDLKLPAAQATKRYVSKRLWPDLALEVPVLADILCRWQAEMRDPSMHRYVYEVLKPLPSLIASELCFRLWWLEFGTFKRMH
jgi:hypothetical protein